jgi:tannase
MTHSSKLYAYYQGCSEGGREGFSQVQRFPEEWDGAVIGAPAIRYGQQQVNHLFPQVAQKTVSYIPPYCELQKIVNLTISACDSLGKLPIMVFNPINLISGIRRRKEGRRCQSDRPLQASF